MSVFKLVFAVILSVLTSLFSFTVGNNFRMAKDPDVQLTAALVADTHITDSAVRKGFFSLGLKDITKHVKPDVFIHAGDCTDNGNDANWTAFRETVEKDLDVPASIIAIGNHDTWADYDSEHEYDEAKKLYLKYANEIMGTDYDEVWFTTEVNGYTFIVMGTEGSSVGATISDAQINWVAARLAESYEPGRPIFVINHQPMNFTHGIGDNENNNGFSTEGASEKLLAVLDRYENVFFINGHTHFGLNDGKLDYPEGFTTVERVGENVTSINLPSYSYGSFGTGGYAINGQGMVMRVFPDRVEFTGRNFALCNNVKDFTVTVDITGA